MTKNDAKAAMAEYNRVCATFNRLLSGNAYADLKAALPGVKRRHIGVTHSGDHYFVQIATPGFQRMWEGRAEDAAHARASAYFAWLRELTPEG